MERDRTGSKSGQNWNLPRYSILRLYDWLTFRAVFTRWLLNRVIALDTIFFPLRCYCCCCCCCCCLLVLATALRTGVGSHSVEFGWAALDPRTIVIRATKLLIKAVFHTLQSTRAESLLISRCTAIYTAVRAVRARLEYIFKKPLWTTGNSVVVSLLRLLIAIRRAIMRCCSAFCVCCLLFGVIGVIASFIIVLSCSFWFSTQV